jgi:hypothetical protein
MLYEEVKVQRDDHGIIIRTKAVTDFIVDNAPQGLVSVIKARPFRALQPMCEEQKRNKLIAFPDVLEMKTEWGDKFKIPVFNDKTRKSTMKDIPPIEDWTDIYEKEKTFTHLSNYAFESPTASPAKKVRPSL